MYLGKNSSFVYFSGQVFAPIYNLIGVNNTFMLIFWSVDAQSTGN